jgi:hypothetical protein
VRGLEYCRGCDDSYKHASRIGGDCLSAAAFTEPDRDSIALFTASRAPDARSKPWRLPMRQWFVSVTALAVLLSVAGIRVVAQRPATETQAYAAPRTPDGLPDLQGVWQALTTSAWDLQDHPARLDVPGGQGVVEGNDIPYQPWAAAKQKENFENRKAADPLLKCDMPGVPRVTYLPFPFQIFQTTRSVVILYEYIHVSRIIYTDRSPHPYAQAVDFWMGDSRGHYEGDTLVVDVTNLNDQTWFDAAGNFHSDALHVIERYTPIGRDQIRYEVTIEDPKVFTRPWKMRMLLYRHREPGAQILEYECYAYALEERSAK